MTYRLKLNIHLYLWMGKIKDIRFWTNTKYRELHRRQLTFHSNHTRHDRKRTCSPSPSPSLSLYLLLLPLATARRESRAEFAMTKCCASRVSRRVPP